MSVNRSWLDEAKNELTPIHVYRINGHAYWPHRLEPTFTWSASMTTTTWNRVLTACVFLLAIGLIVSWSSDSAFGQRKGATPPAGGGAHYSVVLTEGHNLLVTDNGANKLYFYTTDKDKPIGSPLKLRASVDLTHVGQEEIKITPHNLEKFEPAPAKK
jgi:hypothetical protein